MDFVGNLLLFAAVKNFANRSRIDKVMAMDNRYVTDFAKLCELLVCDRIESTLSDSCL